MKQTQSENTLCRLLAGYLDQDALIAFSGGVDSTLLLRVAADLARQQGVTVHGVTFQTTLHPRCDIALAESLAGELGVAHHVIVVDELENAGIRNNPVDRCYRCKKYLFTRLRAMADSMGIRAIMDGTNADDLKMYRPGLRALRELGILSPLAEAGMSKDDVRAMAAKYGLSVAQRPSAPCLATRFPYDTLLTEEMMRSVEEGENVLRSLGFGNLRLRVHGELVRLELDPEDFPRLLQHRDQVVHGLKQLGYVHISLDLEGFRSGSMDWKIAQQARGTGKGTDGGAGEGTDG